MSAPAHVKSTRASEHDRALARLRSEFIEMPGLRLTPAQAARLFGIERQDCERLLRSLVHHRFLTEHHDGSFARCG